MSQIRQKENVTKFFDEFENYNVYYKGPWKYFRKRFMKELHIAFSNAKDIKVLDLGCGRSSTLPQFIKNNNVSDYTCVDISPESIKELKKEYLDESKVTILESDIIKYVRESKKQFDVIMLFGVVMYLTRDDAKELFLHCRNIISERGIILMQDPNYRAKNYIDEHGEVITVEFLEVLKGQLNNQFSTVMRNYNILALRGGVFLVFRGMRKIFRMMGIQSPGFISVFENCSWYLESVVETVFSKTFLGCDSFIVFKRG